MDYMYLLCSLFILIQLRGCTKGENLNENLNVVVSIWDGKVSLYWNAPELAETNLHYDVEITRYGTLNWMAVPHCNKTLLYCDLSEIINNTHQKYLVRVRVVTGQNVSAWSQISVNLRESQLLPPVFSLSADFSSMNVRIHTNPFLKKIFLYGLKYHIYLREKGSNQMKQNATWEEDRGNPDVTLDSLQWGREYCVRLTVEDPAGTTISSASEEQCLTLPLPEWYPFVVLAFAIICVLGVSLLVFLFLHCFLRRPEKLPITLKLPGTGWQPLIVGEISVEVVTDRGFLLMSRKAEEKTPKMAKAVGAEDAEARRGSMDSGVSMDQHSSDMDGEARQECSRQRKEDSGCGSLDGAEGSTGRRGMEELPEKNGKNESSSWVRLKQEGVVSHYSGAANLEADNCSLTIKPLPHLATQKLNQRSTSVEIQARGQGEVEVTDPSDTDSSVVVTAGYRPSQLACVCSGQGLCLWCRVGGRHQQSEDSSQPVAHKLASSTVFVQEENLKMTATQPTGLLGQGDSLFHLNSLPKDSSEFSDLLIATPQLTLLEKGFEFNSNTLPLSIYNMDLTFG